MKAIEIHIPIGKELYYYDVNSLYPYVIKHYPMPSGEPVWQDNCEDMDLDLFGFLEAYIVAPHNMKRPFLPYRTSKNTLIFPPGEVVSVYYSEDLKYAKSIGCQVTPLCGYIFHKMDPYIPFKDFVTTLSTERIKAKNEGNESQDYVYKLLMNSLYGRFGINPQTSLIEICNYQRYLELIRTYGFVDADKINDSYYIVNYKINTESTPDIEWKPSKIAAVQLAAEITACARIHMYPYISRKDCHYIDTNSILIKGRLPDYVISSMELGKLKLEYASYDAICLAAKNYCLFKEGHADVIKHKGLTIALVTLEWYKKQYANLDHITHTTMTTLFNVNLKTLDIGQKHIHINLETTTSTKREAVFDKDGVWVDTKTFVVKDYAGQDKRDPA
ncbi:hypothetical protein CQW23_12040 [Capsicum baccatum]|uniref:DNA-directed DNA polymerase n=1 Tax=Capsicum baccatum TaxID=33114 RepID=A0A2G2WRK4_CAPBA|nr:hypothetical protein CQW23_12040 [Capsicum baccatum]